MILRAWSGALVDTAEYRWTIWPRWAIGWLRFAWTPDPPRCRAWSEAGLRCWERRGHRRPHEQQRRSGEWVRWVETPTPTHAKGRV